MLNNCKNGNHNLIEIYSCGTEYEKDIVRWCSVCGCVVVDKDIDGRTLAGYNMKMKAPLIYKNK